MQSVNLKIIERWKPWLLPCCLCVLLLAGTAVFGDIAEDSSGVPRSRVYRLDHITSKQAQEFLMQLNIGKSYNPLSSDVLIVTSDFGSDLNKATEIVNVLDQTLPAQIRSLMVISPGNPAPPLEAFFATLETISVGTMTDGPTRGSNRPAIVDVLGDKLIAIGTEDVLNQIETALENWQKEHPAETPEDNNIVTIPSESSEKQPQILDNKSETQIQPTSPAELDVPETIESKPETTEPVKSETIEEPAVADEPQQSEQVQLAEIAEQVFESPVDTNMNDLSVESQGKSEEDFLSDGMFEELSDAEQNTAPADVKNEVPAEPMQTEPVIAQVPEKTISEDTTETAVVDQPSSQTKMPDALRERIQALLKQPKDEAQQMPAVSEKAETTPTKLMPQPPSPSGPEVSEDGKREDSTLPEAEGELKTATLQAELAALRQRLAELEAKTAKEPPVPSVAEETKVIPMDESESKVQTEKPLQTTPQIEPELAKEELEVVKMTLPEKIGLEALVDMVGEQLGLNYLYEQGLLDNQDVQLKVFGEKIKVTELYSMLELVLRQKGFVMTRHGQLVTIVKANDANAVIQKGDIPILEPGDPFPPGTIVVGMKFTLENISTASAKNMLTQMQLGLANGLKDIPETGTLIVMDYTYRMKQIQQILDMIDVPTEEREYEFRTLKYMEPTEMVPKLQDLAEQLQDVSLQINASAAAAPAQRTRTVRKRDPKTGKYVTTQVPITPPRTAANVAQSQTEPEPDSVFIDTDDRTNRILMAGRRDQIDLINELIDALDVPQYDLKTVREYIIENVEASEVVDVIEELALGSVSVSRDTMTSTLDRRMTSRRTATNRTPSRTPTPQSPTTTTTSTSLDQGQPSQIYISIRPATNSLLVNATVEQHKAIELVIAHVDVVQKDQRTIRQYEIQYVDTQEIITTLEDLGIIAPQETSRYDSYSSRSSRDQTRSTRSTASARNANLPDTAEAAVPLSLPSATGGSEKEITADMPQISVLETTNSLLVYATPRQHEAIALVIAHADREIPSTNTPYVVYALENQDPADLEGVLTQLIQETVEETQRTSSPTDKIQTRPGTATTTPAKVPTLEEENIRVIADPMSYSLIVYANKRNQQWISELIKELDAYRPQVLLDCTLVEITKQDDFSYDLNVLNSVPDLTYTSGLTGTVAEGITKDDILDKLLDPTSDRNRFIDLQANSGNFTGFYGNDKIMVLLTAMQTKDYGRVLANPKLLVDDNQTGTISTTTTTHVTRTSTNFQNTESGDPIQTTNTNFDPYDATISMEITPHISKGNNLRLTIALSRSDFLSIDLTGETPPDLADSQVGTTVTVPDNATIILGGMDKINQGKGGDKVPILGDIPLIGGLFRSTSNTNTQSKLYVFVKAHILRPGDDMSSQDLKNLSNRYRKEFEESELEMQKYEDWPGIKPKPIDPTKVLEDDAFKAEEISQKD